MLPPSNYKIIQTKDGSNTLFDTRINEPFNSYFGAASEANYYFIKMNGLLQTIKRPIHILEIGLGQGSNLLEVLKLKGEIYYYSLEQELELIDYTINRLGLKFTKQNDTYIHESLDFKIHLINADASTYEFIPTLKFDFFFHDPFSPKNNPKLWDFLFFSKLKMVANQNAILTTYSSASLARKNLTAAGWNIKKITGFAGKKEALYASSSI